jgi:hypothetical protein
MKMVVDIRSLNHKEKFALLYGIMLGDGCLSLVNGKSKFISITGSLDDDLPFYKEVISLLLKEFRGKDTNIKFRKACRAINFNFTDKRLFDLIHSKGFPIGKKGPNLIIPELFYQNNLLKHIVQGFFATDGSLVLTKNPNKFYPRIESRVIHGKLINQLYDYLHSAGMEGNHYNCGLRGDSPWKNIQKQYRFQFNGKKNLLLFNEKIGFVNPKHKLKFDNFMRYNEEYDNNIKGISCSKHYLIRNKVKL